MNSVNSMAIVGMLLLLSACGGSADTASEASAPVADAPDAAAPSTGAVADPFAAAAAGDAPLCTGADMELADAHHKQYPKLVVDAMNAEVKPTEVEVVRFMGIGTWSAVFAATPIADPGWFVFESADGRLQFKGVWAGMAEEDDRQGLIEWAAGLGAPADFAACFAETVIS
ncbi:hypothetical protein [Luteimonas suaedae]|uniref:hypothetical protein n=1 Tax=Luteimonas suaedae TaxID=2605430 RepID=UPI00165A0D3F|nr:hypothetical protein [Luteimonas suaedae]